MIDKMAESIFDSLLNFDEPGEQPMSGLLSEEYWRKFEADFPELSELSDIFQGIDYNNCDSLDAEEDSNVFLNHDCMWGGHCGSKEHSEDSTKSYGIPLLPVIKQEVFTPPTVPTIVPANQQSLLKPSVKAMSQTNNATTFNNNQRSPLTPPESDDEENKTNSSLLKILNEAINECELNGDSDLTDYFENKDIKEEPIEIKEEPLICFKEEPDDDESTDSEPDLDTTSDDQEFRIRTQMAAVNDHSYHKDKNAMMRLNNYELETPSDSEEEEEIDVVSINDVFPGATTTASRMALSLPTNPSSQVRNQLQRTVATAMTKSCNSKGIKTILPVRPMDVSSRLTSATTSPTPQRRGVKRGRGSSKSTNSGYKRRQKNATMEQPESITDKRHMHNTMEKQRRVGLRNDFDNLRDLVPQLTGSKKTAKVHILMQAAHYCYQLNGAHLNYTRQLEELRRKQVWLRQRVSQLRKSLAAKR